MSTYLYLRCDAHDPPLLSEDEVGQHLYDLPTIRGWIKHRQCAWIKDGVIPEGYFAKYAWRFLQQHADCPISIEDEYGREHPLEETP